MQHLGLGPAVQYAFEKVRRQLAPPLPRITWLRSAAALHPLQCRRGSSDLDVFGQIFVGREYRCLDDVTDAGLIVDCGANVGYSAAYFLSRFPRAEIIAVEPDPANFAALSANLAPYGSRQKALCTGVWSHTTDLVISEVPFRDGREWSQTVRPARAGESGAMKAVDIGSILASSGHDRIAILKVDIEGAESEVFASTSNYQEWIGKVDNLVIEIHSEAAKTIVLAAVANRGFTTSQCDELVVCKRPRGASL